MSNKTFFFGSYQFTRAITSYIDEASNSRRMPQALTDDRSDAGIDQFATAIGVENVADINPISRQLLQATFPDGSFLIPSGANGFDCEDPDDLDKLYPGCEVLSVIPGTFEQDQFTINIDHQLTANNKLSGRFFFTDQPIVDPLANSRALSLFERLEDTGQRTLSVTDIHVFSPTVINEFRAGFFRNRNDTKARAHFTNAEFGINNPLTSERPDLALIIIRSPKDVGDEIRFGTNDDQILDIQKTYTFGDTLSFTRGKHSIKLGGEHRRNQLNGDLQETKNGEFRIDKSWFKFLTVGRAGGDMEEFDDISLNYGETVRGYRFNDYSFFIADDWKVTSSLTLNLGVRYDYFGSPWEVNGVLNNFDFDRAVAANDIFQGYTFASNFNPAEHAGFEGLSPIFSPNKSIIPADRNNFAPRFGFAWSPQKRLVFRGGYGIFYERTTGSFANSLRQAVPFFREEQIDNRGDWNDFPTDTPTIPVPNFIVGFDDGEPIVATAENPTTEFETFEAQVIPANISTPYIQQWSLNVQWELMPDLLLQVGYVGTKGTKLIQIANVNQPLDIEQVPGGFLARPGDDVPGGGLTTNYFQIVNDVFVPIVSPVPLLVDIEDVCDTFDLSFPEGDPDNCLINSEARLALLGFDEDEGVNTAFSNSNSIYNSLQISLEKRFSRSYMFNTNYTFSKSIDTYSDEGKYQIEHDQTRPFLNRGLSDFHRRHRLIMSWVWDLPFKGNPLVSGWSVSGIGTFQSGRPFSILDDDYSSVLFDSRNPRPNIASGFTHADLTTSGPVNSRVDAYLTEAAFVDEEGVLFPGAIESSGAVFGNLGRNTVNGPDQRRFDLALFKLTNISEKTSLEFRAEFFNAFNTVSFRNPENDLDEGDFGEIRRTRGGPRVIQFGLKLRF